MKNVILDVDTGTDDAIAIMLAALHPEINLVACTTVNGNVELEHTTDNTLRVLDHIGTPHIPVYAGMSRPIVRADLPAPRRDRDTDADFHGTHLPLPETKLKAQDRGAVEFLIDTYRHTTEPITLVPVGPLSNLATALALYPKLVNLVPEIVVMGGGHAVANVTPGAEFNIWADPEAADVVFSAGFETVTLVPLDATHQALVSLDDCAALRACRTPAGLAAADIIERRIRSHDIAQPMKISHTAPVHDALCIAYLIDPAVMGTERFHVGIETGGRLTLGQTVIDMNHRGNQEPNCDVALSADVKRFVSLLLDSFA